MTRDNTYSIHIPDKTCRRVYTRLLLTSSERVYFARSALLSDELTATLATAGLGVPMGAASLVATDTWPDTAMPPLQLERRSGNLMRRKSRVACKVMQSKSGQEYLCD